MKSMDFIKSTQVENKENVLFTDILLLLFLITLANFF